MTKLLGISGSLRRESWNTKLMHEAIRVFDPAEHQVADLNLPLFNEDVEAEGQPAAVAKICEQIQWADAIVIASPEYNKAPPGVLKNMLDWVSRPRPAPMVGKPVAVMSATAGMAGGERTKSALYLMLIPFQVQLVLHPEVNLGGASGQFDEGGQLKDGRPKDSLAPLMTALKAAAGG
ncbi:MAG: NAD(P)H-dependent oxidoreductase [Pseudomonadota bacterium]